MDQAFLDKIKSEVEVEISQDVIDEAKDRVKSKALQLRQAKKIVKNLQRDYDDLLADIGEELE